MSRWNGVKNDRFAPLQKRRYANYIPEFWRELATSSAYGNTRPMDNGPNPTLKIYRVVWEKARL